MMPINIRLTEKEQEKIREKSIRINKLLVGMEKAPLKESELIHAVLADAISRAEISKEGYVFLPE